MQSTKPRDVGHKQYDYCEDCHAQYRSDHDHDVIQQGRCCICGISTMCLPCSKPPPQSDDLPYYLYDLPV